MSEPDLDALLDEIVADLSDSDEARALGGAALPNNIGQIFDAPPTSPAPAGPPQTPASSRRLRRISRPRSSSPPPPPPTDPWAFPSDDEAPALLPAPPRTPAAQRATAPAATPTSQRNRTAELYEPQETGKWWTKQVDRIGWDAMKPAEQRKMSHVARIEEQPQHSMPRNPRCKKCTLRETRNGAGTSPCKVYTHQASEQFEGGRRVVAKCSKCRVGGEKCE